MFQPETTALPTDWTKSACGAVALPLSEYIPTIAFAAAAILRYMLLTVPGWASVYLTYTSVPALEPMDPPVAAVFPNWSAAHDVAEAVKVAVGDAAIPHIYTVP